MLSTDARACRRVGHVQPRIGGGLLELADANAIKTLAFPSISTGIYGYPLEEAAKVAIAATRRFLASPNGLGEVIFCCFSERDLMVYGWQLEKT